MKWLAYVKALGLVLNLSIEAVLAMEQPESSPAAQVAKHTPRPLKELCVKSIKREIKREPFFAFNEAEKLKKKLLDELKDPSDYPRFTEEKIYEILSSHQLINRQAKEDPPFFLLKDADKEIYVLGSQHTVPLYRCLPLPALRELERISLLNPTFYMEHGSFNKHALTLLQQIENQIEGNFLSYNFDFIFQIGLPQEVGKEFKECGKGKQFLLDTTETSTVELLEVLKAKPWLGAMLLGSHANILSYKKFGGLESELMYNPYWSSRWRERRFLETDIEILDIQKKYEREGKDTAQNRSWAQKSIRSIIPFIKSDEETLEELNSKTWTQKLESYSWDVINIYERSQIPESVIERQTLWAKRLLECLHKEKDLCPLFIVVGDGHLPGYNQGWSFLSLLNGELKWDLLRFTSERGWTKIK